MEITINIPKNNYVQPTEVRQEVVQGICEAFLANNAWSTYHPFHNGRCRNAHHYIIRHKGYQSYYGFRDRLFDSDEGTRFNGEEMKAAFKALIDAGYHMFKYYEFGEWMGYVCSRKPFFQGGERVTQFNDFID